MPNKTTVTEKEIADAMQACRVAKEHWEAAKLNSSIARGVECQCLNDYEAAKKKFEEIVAATIGEFEK